MSTDTTVSIGEAVRVLRKRRGLRQDELAGRIGLGSAQTLSQIERGERSLKATEVVRIADFFCVSALDLLAGRVPPDGPRVLWRSLGDMSRRAEEEAGFLHRCQRFSFLERITGEPAPPGLPEFPLSLETADYDNAADLADEVRRILQLGEVPGLALRSNLESHWRIKIFEARLQSGSGATTWGEFGPAVLENAAESPKRRAFSLAHELFHLLTWGSVASRAEDLPDDLKQKYERLANAFASSLLLPRDAMETRLKGRRLQRLLDLVPVAQSFSVSLPALLWRLVNLDVLDKDRVERLLDPEAPLWGSTDPGWTVPRVIARPLPERYVSLAFMAYARGDISIGKFAELLETNVGMLEHSLEAYGLDLNADAYQAEVFPA